MTEFFDASEAALTTKESAFGKGKYPWATIPVGKAFAMPKSAMKPKTLISYLSRMGKQHGKLFRMVDHGSAVEVYEIACVGMRETAEQIQAKERLIEKLQAETNINRNEPIIKPGEF